MTDEARLLEAARLTWRQAKPSDGDCQRAALRVAASLRRLLFLPGSAEIYRDPAGLFDPQAYVSNLITMFEEIARNVRPDLLKSIRFFKLTAPTILRGQLEDRRWQTVFAHCGGWHRHPLTKCGNNPIHLGNSEICPECGFLICMECAYCSESCTLREGRMHARASNAAECSGETAFAEAR